MRPIDGDALIVAIERMMKHQIDADDICEMIQDFPPIEPERKKGKWNFTGDNMFECTYCGVVYTTQQLNGLRNYDVDPYAPKFCPNCGADMMREQDGKST